MIWVGFFSLLVSMRRLSREENTVLMKPFSSGRSMVSGERLAGLQSFNLLLIGLRIFQVHVERRRIRLH
jgi:hypothetical protein